MRLTFCMMSLVVAGLVGNICSAEVPVIDNPLEAPIQRTVDLEEVWRIGDNEDEDFLLGVIGKVIHDGTGCFYMLDTQQSEIFKFSPDGQYLKSVSRKGEGPGEINMCYNILLWDDNTIACKNGSPNKIVMVDLEGIPQDSLLPATLSDFGDNHRPSLYSFAHRDGFMVGSGAHHLYKEGQQSQFFFLSAFDDQANEVYCFDQRKTGYNFHKPIIVDDEADFLPYSNWTLGNGGEVYVATRRTEYFIEVFDFQGNPRRVIQREWPLKKRSKDEIEKVKNGYTFSVSGMEMPKISYEISDYSRAISRMLWIDNQLWIQNEKDTSVVGGPQTFSFDIFDGKGNLLEKRTFQLPVNPKEDRVHWLDGGLGVVVTNVVSARKASVSNDVDVQYGDGQKEDLDDELAVLEVVLYRVLK